MRIETYRLGLLLFTSFIVNACGGGGGGSGSSQNVSQSSSAQSNTSSSQTDFEKGIFSPASTYADMCGAPRTGIDSSTGSAFPDGQGTFVDENNWIRAWSNDLYLWYSEIEDVDPESYSGSTSAVLEYFDLMKSFETTASGASKDRFHFTYDTEEWNAYSQSGVTAGYGAEWVLLSSSPPRKIVVAYTEPNSPATTGDANLARGAEILTADGVDVINGSDTATLNAAFFPANTGETHTFEVKDLGSEETRTISLTSASVTIDPVQNVKVLETDSGKVGYLTFNNHIATAESELISAITTLSESNITDLVLDLRYNSGGYLAIASQLAYMIAGPSASGQTFELLQFNDKHPSTNPVTGNALTPTPFYSNSIGLSVSEGSALPYLNLSRVFVLTSADTCSASEAIMNGLRGIDVEVIQIGGTTCGKPYGFYGLDNCGTTYFSIQFKGVNAKGYGDYSDGFSPVNTATVEGEPLPGCVVSDDYEHALGDANEAMLSAALNYRSTFGSCPALPVALSEMRNARSNTTATIGEAPLSRMQRPHVPGRVALKRQNH